MEAVDAIVTHEENGWTSCPEYQAALLVFYRRHLCRLDPWPASLERSFAGLGHEVYETMCGPSEFTVVGNLRGWDVLDRLHTISVPALVTGGRHDECTPAHLEEIHRRIDGSELVIIEDASHLCFTERRDQYMGIAREFLRRVEEPWRASSS